MLTEALTPGERLWLLRRRKRQNIEKAAAEYGVSAWVYSQWETDQNEGPDPELDIVHPWEHYAILRRRSGMTQKEVAKLIGISQRRVCYMEHGEYSHAHLMVFWEGK
jgi:transcriptional regulator with XRE-family HTH domain